MFDCSSKTIASGVLAKWPDVQVIELSECCNITNHRCLKNIDIEKTVDLFNAFKLNPQVCSSF
jgi:hypothetical protein